MTNRKSKWKEVVWEMKIRIREIYLLFFKAESNMDPFFNGFDKDKHKTYPNQIYKM